MKKAIVTGGAGFIGSHLVKRLLKLNYDVIVIDDLSSGYLHNLPKEKVMFFDIDLKIENSLNNVPVKNVEVVFHLASHVGQELSFNNPIHDFHVNGLATLLLLEWCKKNKINKFIFASSMNVYGNSKKDFVSEKDLLAPPSPYAVGKISSEYFCNIYQNLGIDCTSLRLFNVYGPNQDLSNIMQGMVTIYLSYILKNEPILVKGSMDRFRDFIYVQDVVNAFISCLNQKASGKTYNVSTARKTYVKDILKMILLACDEDPLEYPIIEAEGTIMDQFGIYGDYSLIKKDLGWVPKIALEEGLGKLVSWAKNSGN